ncbi:hypothetical protein L873DRAFT_200395 [Choiromyces venosus 120613-1]|uniref:Uncharacterized protein n=1 Tax=Choiromyces venosus 120613-1 TaxID=1336337 RepID=A0A3N4JER4_9PEZI|nr:hypothetical protein L873DRAFT_200395 [Choiromyces venosus 120613-1]
MSMSISASSGQHSGHSDRMSIISTSDHRSGHDEMSISTDHPPSSTGGELTLHNWDSKIYTLQGDSDPKFEAGVDNQLAAPPDQLVHVLNHLEVVTD